MSLLLCFFIMLFALSIITPPRFQAIADTLRQDFTGFAGASRERVQGKQTTTTVTDSAAKDRRISALAGGQPIPGPEGEATNVQAILLDGETIRVIRFELDSDERTEQAEWDLRAIFPVLRGSPQKIMVRGYVTPEESAEAERRGSDLAFFRAISVVDYLVSLGLDPSFFEIAVAPMTVPDINVLPPGTEPRFAGASAEIILLNQTRQQLQ